MVTIYNVTVVYITNHSCLFLLPPLFRVHVCTYVRIFTHAETYYVGLYSMYNTHSYHFITSASTLKQTNKQTNKRRKSKQINPFFFLCCQYNIPKRTKKGHTQKKTNKQINNRNAKSATTLASFLSCCKAAMFLQLFLNWINSLALKQREKPFAFPSTANRFTRSEW